MEDHRADCGRVSFDSEDDLRSHGSRNQSTSTTGTQTTTSLGEGQFTMMLSATHGIRRMDREMRDQKRKAKDAEKTAKDAEMRAQAAERRIAELEREISQREEQLHEERDGHIMEIEDLHEMYKAKLKKAKE
ncbi:hypothetical protein PG996_013918 [Apiospora saccharicola]|uniref:Uncharacterized protein n=1 Tax=Apiospora saccharicola TaxID=335842 RepID=A0ABR1TGU8_9PEZI